MPKSKNKLQSDIRARKKYLEIHQDNERLKEQLEGLNNELDKVAKALSKPEELENVEKLLNEYDKGLDDILGIRDVAAINKDIGKKIKYLGSKQVSEEVEVALYSLLNEAQLSISKAPLEDIFSEHEQYLKDTKLKCTEAERWLREYDVAFNDASLTRKKESEKEREQGSSDEDYSTEEETPETPTLNQIKNLLTQIRAHEKAITTLFKGLENKGEIFKDNIREFGALQTRIEALKGEGIEDETEETLVEQVNECNAIIQALGKLSFSLVEKNNALLAQVQTPTFSPYSPPTVLVDRSSRLAKALQEQEDAESRLFEAERLDDTRFVGLGDYKKSIRREQQAIKSLIKVLTTFEDPDTSIIKELEDSIEDHHIFQTTAHEMPDNDSEVYEEKTKLYALSVQISGLELKLKTDEVYNFHPEFYNLRPQRDAQQHLVSALEVQVEFNKTFEGVALTPKQKEEKQAISQLVLTAKREVELVAKLTSDEEVPNKKELEKQLSPQQTNREALELFVQAAKHLREVSTIEREVEKEPEARNKELVLSAKKRYETAQKMKEESDKPFPDRTLLNSYKTKIENSVRLGQAVQNVRDAEEIVKAAEPSPYKIEGGYSLDEQTAIAWNATQLRETQTAIQLHAAAVALEKAVREENIAGTEQLLGARKIREKAEESYRTAEYGYSIADNEFKAASVLIREIDELQKGIEKTKEKNDNILEEGFQTIVSAKQELQLKQDALDKEDISLKEKGIILEQKLLDLKEAKDKFDAREEEDTETIEPVELRETVETLEKELRGEQENLTKKRELYQQQGKELAQREENFIAELNQLTEELEADQLKLNDLTNEIGKARELAQERQGRREANQKLIEETQQKDREALFHPETEETQKKRKEDETRNKDNIVGKNARLKAQDRLRGVTLQIGDIEKNELTNIEKELTSNKNVSTERSPLTVGAKERAQQTFEQYQAALGLELAALKEIKSLLESLSGKEQTPEQGQQRKEAESLYFDAKQYREAVGDLAKGTAKLRDVVVTGEEELQQLRQTSESATSKASEPIKRAESVIRDFYKEIDDAKEVLKQIQEERQESVPNKRALEYEVTQLRLIGKASVEITKQELIKREQIDTVNELEQRFLQQSVAHYQATLDNLNPLLEQAEVHARIMGERRQEAQERLGEILNELHNEEEGSEEFNTLKREQNQLSSVVANAEFALNNMQKLQEQVGGTKYYLGQSTLHLQYTQDKLAQKDTEIEKILLQDQNWHDQIDGAISAAQQREEQRLEQERSRITPLTKEQLEFLSYLSKAFANPGARTLDEFARLTNLFLEEPSRENQEALALDDSLRPSLKVLHTALLQRDLPPDQHLAAINDALRAIPLKDRKITGEIGILPAMPITKAQAILFGNLDAALKNPDERTLNQFVTDFINPVISGLDQRHPLYGQLMQVRDAFLPTREGEVAKRDQINQAISQIPGLSPLNHMLSVQPLGLNENQRRLMTALANKLRQPVGGGRELTRGEFVNQFINPLLGVPEQGGLQNPLRANMEALRNAFLPSDPSIATLQSINHAIEIIPELPSLRNMLPTHALTEEQTRRLGQLRDAIVAPTQTRFDLAILINQILNLPSFFQAPSLRDPLTNLYQAFVDPDLEDDERLNRINQVIGVIPLMEEKNLLRQLPERYPQNIVQALTQLSTALQNPNQPTLYYFAVAHIDPLIRNIHDIHAGHPLHQQLVALRNAFVPQDGVAATLEAINQAAHDSGLPPLARMLPAQVDRLRQLLNPLHQALANPGPRAILDDYADLISQILANPPAGLDNNHALRGPLANLQRTFTTPGVTLQQINQAITAVGAGLPALRFMRPTRAFVPLQGAQLQAFQDLQGALASPGNRTINDFDQLIAPLLAPPPAGLGNAHPLYTPLNNLRGALNAQPAPQLAAIQAAIGAIPYMEQRHILQNMPAHQPAPSHKCNHSLQCNYHSLILHLMRIR